MKVLATPGLLLLAALSASAHGAEVVDCSVAERSLAKPFASWGEAHLYYERHRARCSDGALAEALSAQFTQLLSKQWERLPELQRLATNDPKFLEWVLLGVYYDPEEIEVNASNTACRLLKRLQSCQPSEKPLCEQLSARVGPDREYIRRCGA